MKRPAGPEMVRAPGGPERIDLRKLPTPDAERLGQTLLPLVREIWEEEQKAKRKGGAA